MSSVPAQDPGVSWEMSRVRMKRHRRTLGGSLLVNVLGLLRSDARRRILIALAAGPTDVATLASELNLSTSAVRRHLGRLRDRRLVKVKRGARPHLYRLHPHVSAIVGRWKVILNVSLADGSRVPVQMQFHGGCD